MLADVEIKEPQIGAGRGVVGPVGRRRAAAPVDGAGVMLRGDAGVAQQVFVARIDIFTGRGPECGFQPIGDARLAQPPTLITGAFLAVSWVM